MSYQCPEMGWTCACDLPEFAHVPAICARRAKQKEKEMDETKQPTDQKLAQAVRSSLQRLHEDIKRAREAGLVVDWYMDDMLRAIDGYTAAEGVFSITRRL